MATIILLDTSVSIPLALADKFDKDLSTKESKIVELNPVGECSDALAEHLIKTYPLKYALYDEKKHKNLIDKNEYPEAKAHMTSQVEVEFAKLSKEQKIKAIAYIKKLNKEVVTEVIANA